MSISIMMEFRFEMSGPKRLKKNMAMVPKGFLRHQVLKLLNEKPMSGSEIMSEIEKQTNGQWRPSPGSVYPMLSWLEKKGFIKEDEVEPGMKRYALTEQGKTLLKDLLKIKDAMMERLRHFKDKSQFMEMRWLEALSEKSTGIVIAMQNLSEATFRLMGRLKQEYSEETAEEARKALEETAMKIEDLIKKLSER